MTSVYSMFGKYNWCFVITNSEFKDLAIFKPKSLRNEENINIWLTHYYECGKDKILKKSKTLVDVTLTGKKYNIHSQHCL
jgi:hypothetical protein